MTFSLQDWANLGTAVVPAIAVAALGVTWWQVRTTSYNERRIKAYEIYQGFLDLALEYPDLAFGDETCIVDNKERYKQYKWFVARMLFSFEEVLVVCGAEEDWKRTITHQIRRHIWHISQSSSVQRGEWKPGLMRIIQTEIAIHNFST